MMPLALSIPAGRLLLARPAPHTPSRSALARPPHTSTMDEASTSSGSDRDRSTKRATKVAYWDVDGTIIRSNIFAPYVLYQLSKLNGLDKLLFIPSIALKGLAYLIIDKFDRTLFNNLFYSNYSGMPTAEKDAMARMVMTRYFVPKMIPAAKQQIADLKSQGYQIVLVTGSLDFLMQPLAQALAVDDVIAAQLEEAGGVFTGRLKGPPISDQEKAVRIRQHAAQNGVDLAACQAYGDSYADLPMLKAVGQPHVVRPDSRLKAVASQQQWPVMEWEAPAKK